MKPTLVSAIITTHNRLPLLKRAIGSVLAQTYDNIELIVVDDASTDGTGDYCRSLPLRYIHIPAQESRGGNHARNRAICMAQGKYVAFLDDDDYWLPMKIEKQVALIESADCEMVYCGNGLELIKAEGQGYRDDLPNPKECGDMSKMVLQTICTITSAILVRRDALVAVGMFDEELHFWQDYELTIRLAQRKPICFVNEILCVYRIDETDAHRLTNRYEGWKEAVKYIHRKHAALYARLNIVERLRAQRLVMRDAVMRSKTSGLTYKYLWLRLLWIIQNAPLRVLRKFWRH